MAPHRIVPILLLSVLGLLTVIFAVVALSQAPNSADLAVHNGTDETFSSQQFTIELTDIRSSGAGTTQSNVRLIDYTGPNTILVYSLAPSRHLVATVHGGGVVTAINQYAALTGGSTGWVRHGSHFDRSESIQAYAIRLKQKTVTTGTVAETAVVRDGYLVADNLVLHINSARLSSGQIAEGGTAQEILHVVRINGAKAPAVSS